MCIRTKTIEGYNFLKEVIRGWSTLSVEQARNALDSATNLNARERDMLNHLILESLYMYLTIEFGLLLS